MGTLLVRVHGLKDSFKITAEPPVEGEDKRILHVYYSPKLASIYTIFVRWSGEHIPGSPFHVVISEPTAGQASSPKAIEEDTSNDLEVNELADLDDDDNDGGHYGEERVASVSSFSGGGKKKMTKSASETSAMSSVQVSRMLKTSSTSSFSSSSGMLDSLGVKKVIYCIDFENADFLTLWKLIHLI